jgi:hypothetical protein
MALDVIKERAKLGRLLPGANLGLLLGRQIDP